MKRILYLIIGTLLIVIGGLGIYGVIGLSDEYTSDLFYLLRQSILPIALLILGIYLLFQFYKKPDNKNNIK
jgi:hypothetical protein